MSTFKRLLITDDAVAIDEFKGDLGKLADVVKNAKRSRHKKSKKKAKKEQKEEELYAAVYPQQEQLVEQEHLDEEEHLESEVDLLEEPELGEEKGFVYRHRLRHGQCSQCFKRCGHDNYCRSIECSFCSVRGDSEAELRRHNCSRLFLKSVKWLKENSHKEIIGKTIDY